MQIGRRRLLDDNNHVTLCNFLDLRLAEGREVGSLSCNHVLRDGRMMRLQINTKMIDCAALSCSVAYQHDLVCRDEQLGDSS